ncbi:hypothetical protein K4F52_006103 [Lecanicillium sp. MT-2017a]|nr:hypothetical protein K4F52_006103 [Lecanicillium sp. MT-2017a]
MSQQDDTNCKDAMRLSAKVLMDHFSRSLTFFQASEEAFRVLCTLPHQRESPCARKPRGAVQRVVVLDSSFNPPTRAHAQMAQSAILEAISTLPSLSSDTKASDSSRTRLVLLLAVNNADKAPKPASFPQRLGMMDALGNALRRRLMKENGVDVEVDLAVTTMPYFNKKAAAIERSGFYRAGEVGESPEQVFLAGFDTVIRIFNPKYYTDDVEAGTTPMKKALGPFFESARLRVTMRPDDEWGSEEQQEAYVKGLEDGKLEEVGGDAAWAKRVELVTGEGGVGVSSSKVRAMVEAGEKGLGDMVDEDVEEWIESEGLYHRED